MTSDMRKDPTYRLMWVSVVISSNNYSPAIFTPNLLLDSEVIDNTWKAVAGASGPEAAVYAFENEIRWGMNKESMTITQEFPSSEQPIEGSFLVHDVAIRYLEKFSQYTYGVMGLNCLINIDFSQDPKDWMKEKFSSHIPGINLLGIETNLIFPSDVPNIYRGIELKPAVQVTRENGKEDIEKAVLSAECNVHHAGLSDAQSFQKAIRGWEKHQSSILASLERLIEGGK